MQILKHVTISILVAALAFLAAFIIAINFYTTWKAFAHETASRSAAFSLGFWIAGIIAAITFCATLYLIHLRKRQHPGPNLKPRSL